MITYGMMKRWDVLNKLTIKNEKLEIDDVSILLLHNRGLTTKREIDSFLNPPQPNTLNPKDVGIDKKQLDSAIRRIRDALKKKESVVVYADYDADGITAGAILWETLYALGGRVMPYIPYRAQGYGLTREGIDEVKREHNPSLIVTVDHGITARDKIEYAGSLGIDVIVTDHHTKPDKLPRCTIVHTTQFSGAGVSWFVAKEILAAVHHQSESMLRELLALATIGTIADLMPLVGPNRAIVKHGLTALNATARVGLKALFVDAGLTSGDIRTYQVSHMLAPRLNAMGRIEHALDALRLLCTPNRERAGDLARKLGLTNRERQQLTEETTLHALQGVALQKQGHPLKKLIFISHESYNQGIIGLVAGKLVDQYYRPSVVVSVGETISKASARSISGFNIVEAIRSMDDILVDVGGHPMAAGFTVETRHLSLLQSRLEEFAEERIGEDMLTRSLRVDTEIPLNFVSEELFLALRQFEPFGFGNPEPVFAARGVAVTEARLVGADGKHLKLRLQESTIDNRQSTIDAIAFNFGRLYGTLQRDIPIDIAYTIDMDTWNGRKRLQLKIKDIRTN